MTQSSPQHRSRALIVEDEPLCALDLEAHMHELGFNFCHLVANGQEAFVQAMSNQPDIVLMDVNLEGNREGIEVAKKLRESCRSHLSSSSPHTLTPTRSSASAKRYRERHSCRSRFGMTALPMPLKRS